MLAECGFSKVVWFLRDKERGREREREREREERERERGRERGGQWRGKEELGIERDS